MSSIEGRGDIFDRRFECEELKTRVSRIRSVGSYDSDNSVLILRRKEYLFLS